MDEVFGYGRTDSAQEPILNSLFFCWSQNPDKAVSQKKACPNDVNVVHFEERQFTRLAGDFWKDGDGNVHQFSVKETDGRLEKAAATGILTEGELRQLACKLMTQGKVLDEFLQMCALFNSKEEHSSETRRKCNYQLARLIAEERLSGKALSKDDIERLALHAARDLALPGKVAQGRRGTCVPAALEICMLRREPLAALKFVVDIALTRKFRPPGGEPIYFSDFDLRPVSEAAHSEPLDGKLSHFSQLFQFGVAKLKWQKRGLDDQIMDDALNYFPRSEAAAQMLRRTNGRGLLTYGIDNDGIEGVRDFASGKILLSDSNAPHPFMGLDDIPAIYAILSGECPRVITLDWSGKGQSPGHLSVAELTDVPSVLRMVKEVCGLPVVVSVRAGGAWHAVNVLDVAEDQVFLDNSWSEADDAIKIPLTEFEFLMVFSGRADLTSMLKGRELFLLILEDQVPPVLDLLRENSAALEYLFGVKNSRALSELSSKQGLQRRWEQLALSERAKVIVNALQFIDSAGSP